MATNDFRKRGLPFETSLERRTKDHRRDQGQRSPYNRETSQTVANNGRNNHNDRGAFSKDQIVQNQLQEAEQMREWVAKEDDFVLKQSKKKARIRVKEGRAKPIDWLAVTLSAIDSTNDALDEDADGQEMEVIDPSGFTETLDLAQSQQLEKDIATYLALEKRQSNRKYWNSLKIICKHQEAKMAPSALNHRANLTVSAEIDKLLGPKTLLELAALEQQISNKLQSNEPLDVEYWENLTRNLGVFKAKAELNAMYKSVIAKRLHEFRRQQRADAAEIKTKMQSIFPSTKYYKMHVSTESALSLDPEPELKLRAEDKHLKVVEETAFVDRYNIEKLRIHNLGYVPSKQTSSEKGAIGTSNGPQASNTISSSRPLGTSKEDPSSTTNALYEREAARGVQDDEEIFAGEEEVSTKIKPQWAGKYRPRKPRYFNRVQMGYEWNKYNQTHYDHDNPPPKVVQGYKFNIFYPDLFDKIKAPTYRIEREGGRKRGEIFAPAGEEDTCLIRFVSGPPYEDIAFRIVDKEWDFSAKRDRGFKSSFDKGILQLHFQFKKVYYRK